MKPALKILLGLAGVLLVLAVGLAIAVAVLFDPKEFQPLLAQSVEKATGRRLTIEGELGLGFLPCCSIRLGHAALGNPPGFPAGDFASVDKADLSIRIWPLLTARRVEIGLVRLDGLTANLIVRKDGLANWKFSGDEAGATAAGSPARGASTTSFRIGGLHIRDGRVAYRDEQAGSVYRAEGLQLETGALSPGQPFDVQFSTRFADTSGGLAGELALRAGALLEADASRLTLVKPVFDFDLSGTPVPAKSLKGRLGASGMTLDAQPATRLRFTAIEGGFTAPGLKSPAGDLSANFTAAEASLGMGAGSGLEVPALKAALEVKGRDIPGGSLAASVSLTGLTLDTGQMAGSIRSFDVDASGLGARLALRGGGRLGAKGSSLAGTLALEPVSPRSLLAALGEPAPHTADPQALTRLGGSAAWALGSDSLDLQKLDLRLDDTRLSGSLGIHGFDKPATRFDLRADQLDLDRYLAPSAGKAAGSGEAGSAAGTKTAADDIPVATLRSLRLDGRIAIGKLVFAGTHLDEVSATLQADGGRLRIDPLSARLYGGSYRGSIGIDATGPKARVTLDQQISGLQVGDVLKDRYQSDKLAGALSGHITASGTGNSSDAILATLGGNVALSLADGAYRGTDLWHEISSARARIKGEPQPPAPAKPQTPLNALELAGTLEDGVLRTSRLLAEIPFIRLSGTGGLNLVARSMDYALQAQVFETPVLADGRALKDLKGLSIPLTVKGPLDQPKVGVDLKNMVAGIATGKLREQLLRKLGGDEQPPAGSTAGPPADQAAAAGSAQPDAQPPQQPQKAEKPRDILKRGLRDLLKPPPEPAAPAQP
ncbi:MAG: AsmA family protein [Gammaproteobacteria bacterium]